MKDDLITTVDKVNMEERKCEYCGKIFYAIKNRIKRFCSEECRIKAKSIRQIERERSNIQPIPCQQCGKMFIPNAKHRKYCSDECCNIYQSEHGLTNIQDMMDKLSTYTRKERIERKCKQCGQTFQTNRHSGGRTDQWYCSDRCRRIAENDRVKMQRRNKQFKPIICEHCGKEFIPNGSQQKYCSKKCKLEVKSRNERIRYQKRCKFPTKTINSTCVLCGKEFTRHIEHGGNYYIRYCSTEHYNIANTIRRRLRSQNRNCSDEDVQKYFTTEYKSTVIHTCLNCGKTFAVNHTHNKKKFCSNECRRDFYNAKHSKHKIDIDIRMKRLMEKNHNIISYSIENDRIMVTTKCKECGVIFSYPYSNNMKLYCSDKCKNGNARKANRKRKFAFNNGSDELTFSETLAQLKSKLRSTEVLTYNTRTAEYAKLKERFTNHIFVKMINKSERNAVKFDDIIKRYGNKFRKTAAVAWIGNHNSLSAALKAIRTIIKNEECERKERILINKRIEEESKVSSLAAYLRRVEKSKRWCEKHADEINKKREETLRAKELNRQHRIERDKRLSDDMFACRMAKLSELSKHGYVIKYTKCEHCGHLIPYTEPINGRRKSELVGVGITRFCNNICRGNWYSVYGKQNSKEEQLVTFTIKHRGTGFYSKTNQQSNVITVKQKHVERYLNGQTWLAEHNSSSETDDLINRVAEFVEIDSNLL